MPPSATISTAQQVSNLLNECLKKIREIAPTAIIHFSMIYGQQNGTDGHFSGGNANDSIKLYFSERMKEEVMNKVRQEIQSPQVDFSPSPLKK